MWSSLFRQKISRTSTGFNSIRKQIHHEIRGNLYPKHRPTRSIWAAQADEIEWYSKPETILSKDENGYPLLVKMMN
jgi:hypothetical protein